MPASKKKVNYIAGYNKDNYKEIRFWFKKDQLNVATERAKENGYETINAYSKALLEAALAGKLEIREND